MTDMETAKTLVTPRGRKLAAHWRTAGVWGDDTLRVYKNRDDNFCADFEDGTQADFKTIPEALSWLDARADETVAALLPPGAIVVTEERVTALAFTLVDEIVCKANHDPYETEKAVARLLSALRAGAQS